MPRHVDPEERRRDIVRAASRLLVDDGLRGVTFASIAAELGGSTTVVTHYYGSIGELLDDLAERAVRKWQEEAARVMAAHPNDPRAQLTAVLFDWMTPLEGDLLEQERVASRCWGADR